MLDDDDQYWRSLPPEEKLNILRHEMLSSVDAVRIATVLLKSIEPDKIDGLPEQFRFWVASLEKAGEHLKRTLDLLTT